MDARQRLRDGCTLDEAPGVSLQEANDIRAAATADDLATIEAAKGQSWRAARLRVEIRRQAQAQDDLRRLRALTTDEPT